MVIALYLLVAVLIVGAQLANAITRGALSDTFLVRELSLQRSLERVGPDTLPGLTEQPTPARRLEHADFMLSLVERALDREDPAQALSAIRFAERTVVQAPPERIEALLDEAYDRLDESDLAYEHYEDLRDQLADARATLRQARQQNARPQAIDQARQALEQARADVDAARQDLLDHLARLDQAVEAIYPMPEGFAGLLYRARLLLGTDSQGRSILWRAIYSIRVATQVGLVSAVLAVVVGAFLGAAAGFFGGWVDHAIVWLYSTLSSVPYIVLLTVVAFVFSTLELTVPMTDGVKISQTLVPMYVAFGVTFWIAPCRQIRGEAIKIRSLDYVQSATALGAGRLYILRRHVIPNVMFLVFINFSLIFIGAIKSEVILSFLGIGVIGQPSWGVMISESKGEVLNQFFWQIGAATAFMFGLVLAFNVFSDALQDAFDPRHAR
ncbi:MAG: hypothetical protein KatS3mg103_0361 [Phycisphaerales bacterium]|nr:MAG: hypothetical protein KatS3mg103_0361 [Phycisphaerales bacterium]